MPTARELLAENPSTPPQLSRKPSCTRLPCFPTLSSCESGSRTPLPATTPETTTGYWKFTKHGVMQALRMGGDDPNGLVKGSDPNGTPTRQTAETGGCLLPTIRFTTKRPWGGL
ncbi:hypothetical protein DFH06DRAFT_1155813 [Mycena polygramma]|nr:hypothetical protein DFH06DRAFT_1155813 [Mycena polygramma]